MKVAVIKYNAGNIRSVSFALERLNVDFTVTDVPEEITSADKVVFPGVGEASSTMQYLRDRNLDAVIRHLRQPTLGICLGMQLLCRHSEENNTPCLGIFDESVQLFRPGDLKVPHMGWNSLEKVTGWLDPSLKDKYVYFVHSYYVPVSIHTTAETTYGVTFSAALRKNNFYAVQFHPEKSAEVGVTILQQFLTSSAA
jgi:imidazole glycerol-phosphate synthase subunit HisH